MLGPEQTEFAGKAILAIDLLGTVAFSVSGVICGWKSRFNFVGVAFLAAATACGGGTIRDILGGKSVPFFLRDPLYFYTIIGVVLLMYLARWVWNRHEFKESRFLPRILEWSDAIGLGVFSIIGANFALHNTSHPDIKPMVDSLGSSNLFELQWYSVILFAILTGAGGGIVRDVVSNRIPYAFSASLYAFFPAIGGALFLLMCSLGEGGINAFTVLVPTTIVCIARLIYWWRWEYEREQFAALILFRDEAGNYLMEEGRSGSLNLIGGKWQRDDGAVQDQGSLRKTAIREAREELGLKIDTDELKRIHLVGKFAKKGNLVFRDRSIRTGEKVLYKIAVFDHDRTLTDVEIDSIVHFRECPVLSRDRLFVQVPIDRISAPKIRKFILNCDSDARKGLIEVEGQDRDISYSLLKRIRDQVTEGSRHSNGDAILGTLPEDL